MTKQYLSFLKLLFLFLVLFSNIFSSHYFGLKYSVGLQEAPAPSPSPEPAPSPSPPPASSDPTSAPPGSGPESGTYTPPMGSGSPTSPVDTTSCLTSCSPGATPASTSGTATTGGTTSANTPPPGATVNSDGSWTSTNTWEGGSSTSTYDAATGTTTYTNTYSYTDPQTGQTTTSTSTSSTQTVTNADGSTSYVSTSTYTDPITGEQRTTSSTSTTRTDPTTGATTTETTSTSFDPITGQYTTYASSYSSQTVTNPDGSTTTTYKSTSTDSRTGQTYGSENKQTSYTDPVTGATGYSYEMTSSYPDWRTGEIVTTTSSSTSTSRTITNSDGSTTQIWESSSTGDYVDWQTGEKTTTTSSSTSSYTTNSDGTTTSISTSSWTDPRSGKESTSTYESTYDPTTGESKSTNTYVDPRDGKTYASTSESTYNSETGESSYTYRYTDPITGQELLSESKTERTFVVTDPETGTGAYTHQTVYTLTDAVTGETVETPYYGCYGGCATGSTYYYLDTDSGATYSYTSDESPDAEVHTYRTPEGSTYVYTDSQNERDALANALGETYAIAVDANLPVGEAENAILSEENLLETVKAGEDIETEIGEPIVSHEEFTDKVEEYKGEDITTEEQKIVTGEYESFEERYKGVEIDPSPETYAEYVDLQDSLGVSEDRRIPNEYFDDALALRYDYYTERDKIYASDLTPEQKAIKQHALEESARTKYTEQFGEVPVSIVPLTQPGTLPTETEALTGTLTVLTPVAIDAIIADEFKDEQEEFEKLGIPENHPKRIALEAQAEAKLDDLLEEQEKLLVTNVVAGCGGSVGGASESCGKIAEDIQVIISGCGTGDAGASCHEVAQILANQFKPEDFVYKKPWLDESERLVIESSDVWKDPKTRDAFVYNVEITPEKLAAKGIYDTYRACTGSECSKQAEDRINEHLEDVHEEWRTQYESLTPEQREKVRKESESRREDYTRTITPALGEVRNELPDNQKPVYDVVDDRFDRMENRIETMEDLRDKAAEKGHDTATLDYYVEQARQSIDAAKDGAVHKDFTGMNGNIIYFDRCFGLYIDAAKDVVKADNTGNIYESPEYLDLQH